jgi:hypothetical protein
MKFENFFADFARLEQVLGLPKDFVIRLLEEDDWSFVIKGHAVIEAAVTHLLIQSFDPKLSPVLERLPLGGGKTGKVSFIEHLGCVPDAALRFIRRFAELRNTLIHGTGAFNFSLTEYLSRMSPADRRTLAQQLVAAVGLENDPEVAASAESFVMREPKASFGFAIFGVLAQALFSIDPAERERAASKAAESAGSVALMILLGLALGIHGARSALAGGGPRQV